MRNINIPKLVIALAVIVGFTTLQSCSRSDDQAAIVNSITDSTYTGNWKVSLFFDDTDETAMFTGYTFTFSDGGVLTATNGTTTITGAWSVTSTKLNISFPATAGFDEVNDDWLIVEKTATTIKLKDDNPAQTDKLEFIKL